MLEWFEKHKDCPIRRVSVATDSEMSRTATSLVGKTRIYVPGAIAIFTIFTGQPTRQKYNVQ
jgi:hypothetical protein